MTHFAPIYDISPFPCDPKIWRRFLVACQNRDASPGAVLRDLVGLEVQRVKRRATEGDNAIDAQLLGRLRLLVAQALSRAESWAELQAKLRKSGLTFVAAGEDLILVDPETDEVLCNASWAGPDYPDLVRRFGPGFPGHPRPGLASQALWAPD